MTGKTLLDVKAAGELWERKAGIIEDRGGRWQEGFIFWTS